VAQDHADKTQTTVYNGFGHTEPEYGPTSSLWICHYLIFIVSVKDWQVGLPEDTKNVYKHRLWGRRKICVWAVSCGVQAKSIIRPAAWWKGHKDAARQPPAFWLTLPQSSL